MTVCPEEEEKYDENRQNQVQTLSIADTPAAAAAESQQLWTYTNMKPLIPVLVLRWEEIHMKLAWEQGSMSACGEAAAESWQTHQV